MATRPRVPIPRSYEDFQPPSNLVQEEDCETLIVDLPGFRKEQVRVQMEDRAGTLLISGERPTGNNKWSRFRKDLRVPVNCNTNEIQAKFENAVLRIIMPLKVVPKTAPPTQMITGTDTKKPIPTPPPPPPSPSQKALTESKPTPKPQLPETPKPIWDPLLTAQFPPSKNATSGPVPTPPPQPPPPSQKPLVESKPGQQPIAGPKSSPLSPPSQKLITEPKPLSSPLSPPSQKQATILPPPPRREPRMSERLRPKPATPVPQDPLDQSPAHTSESNHPPSAKSILSETLGTKSKSDIGQDETTGKKFVSDDFVEKPIHLNTGKPEVGEIQEREKELKGAQELKAHMKGNAGHNVEDYKGRSKRPAMEIDESRQLIVNMVAAVLVVIALWFYTKYTVKNIW